MAQCWPLQVPPVAKAVLMSLADNANDHGSCWPSISKICERTCYGRTAVIDAIKVLEGLGLLEADRSNGRHTRYVIHPKALTPGLFDQSAKRTGSPRGPVRKAADTSPPGGLDQSATRTLTVKNHQEPSKGEGRARSREAGLAKTLELAGLPDIPPWLDCELLAEFIRHRAAIRKPLSISGWLQVRPRLEQLRDSGQDPNKSLRLTMEMGLAIPVNPSELNLEPKNGNHQQRRRESAAERSERINRELDEAEC